MKIHDREFRLRMLFVLGNLVTGALVIWAFVLPICAFFIDRDERILDKQRVLARLSAIAAQEGNVKSILSDTSTQLRGGEFLAGPNENVISAELQARLKAMTEAAGARSRAVQALPSRTVDQIRYSGSRIEVFGSLQSIHRAVYAIESARPYLFTTGAVLKIQAQGNRPDATEEPVMQAQLDVFGAVQVGEREP